MVSQIHQVEGPGCCACLGKVFCSVFLAILLLLVAALSAVAVSTGRFQFWTFLSGNDLSPAYILRCVRMLCLHLPLGIAALASTLHRPQPPLAAERASLQEVAMHG